MKKDKFKKMRLQIQTLEPVGRADDCVMLFSGLRLEMPETMQLSMAETSSRKMMEGDGTLYMELEARGIQSNEDRVKHLRMGKQAEFLDYNYFRSRMPAAVITDVQAEVFDFHRKKVIPFMVKKLEFSFNNGKKADFTDRVSVLSLNRLAS